MIPAPDSFARSIARSPAPKASSAIGRDAAAGMGTNAVRATEDRA